MKLFEEALPIGVEINSSTISNHTLAVAERLENELGDEQAFFIGVRARLGGIATAGHAADGRD